MRSTWTLLLLALLACRGSAGEVRYFPASTQLEELRYAKHLRSLREPAVWATPAGQEVYRFTIVPSFTAPQTFRLVVEDGQAIVVHRKSDGTGGFEAGRLVLDEAYQVETARLAEVRARVDAAAFWTAPTNEDWHLGRDGSRWILEAFRDGRYHVVDRWSPQPHPVGPAPLPTSRPGPPDDDEFTPDEVESSVVFERAPKLAEFAAACEAIAALAGVRPDQLD